jgi:AraC-like DNA-binding protein
MAERLEMVVSGKRRPAMPSAPEFVSRISPTSGFGVEGHLLSDTFELPDHWIPFYLVGVQFTRGKLTRYFLENSRIHEERIDNGKCFVVGPKEVRRFRLEGAGSASLVSIDPWVLEEMTADSPRRSPVELLRNWVGHDPVLRDLILKLRAEVTSGCPTGPLLAESICTKLTEELIQRFSIGRVRPDRYKGGLSGAQLRRAVEYIDASLDLDLSGNGIAAAAGLSKYHFGKAFKQSTGMTLHSYVLARRMRRAQELLHKSDLPLATIAEAAGFSNQSHFTVVFSTRIGISPRAYREMGRRLSVVFP